MIRKIVTSEDFPDYHEGMLIVKMRETAGPTFTLAASRGNAAEAMGTLGMSALSAFERGGLIKRVVPLTRPAAVEAATLSGTLDVMTAMATSLDPTYSNDSNSGVSIIELEHDERVTELQTALTNDPTVDFVSRVPVRYLAVARKGRSRATAYGRRKSQPTSTPADGISIMATPPPASTMWNLRKILWSEARASAGFKDAGNVRVAVLDTGIDTAHPDLQGRISRYVFSHPDVPGVSGERDIIGHGTHVAGTITALINNNVGINGICQCQLFAWKIFDDQTDFVSLQRGFAYFVDPIMYRRALADCLAEGIDVINLSIGGRGTPDQQEKTLFRNLLAGGTTIVAAMGNERMLGSPISFPAAIPGVIAVGATSIDDSVAPFSNRGNHISLSAPGVGIWSTLPTQPGQTGFDAVLDSNGKPKEGKPHRRDVNYDAWDGTSMASPHVAGAVALLYANKGKMSAANGRRALMAAADRVPGMGANPFHPDYGAGRLNLLRLLS